MKKRSMALFAAMVLLVGMLSGCGTKRFTADEARSGVVRVANIGQMDVYAVEDGQITELLISADNVLLSVGSAFGVGEAGKATDIFATNYHVADMSESAGVFQRDENGNPTVVYAAKPTALYLLLDNFAYSDDNGLDPSRSVPCNLIYGSDDNGVDIAILRAANPVSGRIALPLLDQESSLAVNDNVNALGYPGSSDDATSEGAKLATVEDVTVTNGKTSRFYEPASVSQGTGILDNCRYIQHTAAVNHGNSGGPLIDENGTVVGVNTAIHQSEGYGETTAYYALRIQYVKDALDSLGIHYDVYRSGPNPLLIAGIAIAAVAVVVIVLVVLLRKPKPAPQGPAVFVSGPAPAQELRIQGQSGAFAGRRFAINGQVRMGRDPNGNDLVYPDGTPGISGRHCVVTLSGGQATLTDLGSSYGTFLAGGQKLTPNQPVTLRVGDGFYLGSEKERFVITGKGGSLT